MNYKKVIEYKLNMLIDLMLTDGVSPSDLSENIFEKEYISVSFIKKNEYIMGILNFYEEDYDLKNIKMIYTYSKDKKLIRIEEIEDKTRKLLWDRRKREEELIDDLLYFMNYNYTPEQIEKFICSLPDRLIKKINKYIEVFSA